MQAEAEVKRRRNLWFSCLVTVYDVPGERREEKRGEKDARVKVGVNGGACG